MKFVDDIDMTTDGRYAVQWQEEDGYRWWEVFDSEIERSKAIVDNETYNGDHSEERDKILNDWHVGYLEMCLEMIDDGCEYMLTEKERHEALAYRQSLLDQFKPKPITFSEVARVA
jgi:hypothetical protein